MSQNGPDEQRHRAAQVVQEAGLLPAGPVRMWLGAQWQEISFMSFEIHTDLSYWRQCIAFADQPRLGDWRKLLGS